MRQRQRLFHRQPKTISDRYFSDIRPLLYERHANHQQYGIRQGRTLAEHLDSAAQFVLTVSQIAGVPEPKRGIILAATVVHDLNKLDPSGRSVKKLARDKDFLRSQLEPAGVLDLVKTDDDLELVRRLVERHSGHNVSDGMRFFPEDPAIEQYAAMVTAADLFDLGIPEAERFPKIQKELTVAFNRPCHLFRVRLSEDRGYLTALLLGACEEVAIAHQLTPLAIFPDGELFEGQVLPEENLIEEIASVWQTKIDRVFGGNVEQLVKPLPDGIKVDPKAVFQNPEEALVQVEALLEKKKANFKASKVEQDVRKYSDAAGEEAIAKAAEVGLFPADNAEAFAISEGIKAAYLSYREAELSTNEVWNRIASHVGLSPEQRQALEPFNAQYARSLFAAKAVTQGMEGIKSALRESFQLRQANQTQTSQVPAEMVAAAARMLNLPQTQSWQGSDELDAYINANPRKRCSLGTTSPQVDELISPKMPPGIKVQSFSNRLPGGMSGEPKRRADAIAALGYQLMAVGASFPKASKQDPIYLHLALPAGTSPELLRMWRDFLREAAASNAEGGTVSVDELKLYRDNRLEFKSNKVVGFAFPKRPEFIHSTVIIPLTWGDTNASIALLKSLRLALELSLSLELGFPFVLSANLEIEPTRDTYGRVDGIPATLQPLLGDGTYNRQQAERTLQALQCLGQLAVSVASLKKKDDCLYDLARAVKRPLDIFYVLLRWILREQDDPNLEYNWRNINEPVTTLLEMLMPEENDRLTQYLKEAAAIAVEGKIWGSSFKRTAQMEPFSEYMAAIRSRKSHMSWDVVFAALVQNYYTRLDRIRERQGYHVGATKYEKVKQYYDVLRQMFEEIYQSRPEKILADKKTLEAAYLFFLQEARPSKKNEENAASQEEMASSNVADS
jgi:CRISPR-associated protein Csc3